MDEITVVGMVETAAVGATSKSAHEALEIRTDSGSYIFRIVGENPFEISSKHSDLRGKIIRASGYLNGKFLMVRRFQIE